MTDEILYSEADAEFDSHLVFQEIEDLDPITWMGNALLSGTDSSQDSQIRSAIRTHLQNVRFSKFSQESLQAECNNIKDKYNASANNHIRDVSSCESLEEYKAKVSENGCVCAVDIPNVGQMISDAGLVRVEASMKQLKKDIERDRLLVNGTRIVGAESGLDSVLRRICEVCDEVHQECGLPKLGNEAKEYTVLSLLSKASRSHSGGIAFQAAQSLIDPATAMLVPQSAVTPPLKINIYLGAFPEHCRVRVDKALLSTNDDKQDNQDSAAREEKPTPTEGKLDFEQLIEGLETSSTHDTVLVSHAPGKWGLVGKVTCESIFKVQLYDTPEAEVGYDDCSTGELEEGTEDAPCLFKPVPTRSHRAGGRSTSSCQAGQFSPSQYSPNASVSDPTTPGASGTGNTETDSTEAGVGGAQSCSERACTPAGLNVGHRNTFLSVVYEDYVLFEVKLAPPGELSNLENLSDNWKSTATVTITEIAPVRTLM